MKSKIFLSIIPAIAFNILHGQELPSYQKLDLMLMQGEYESVIDTCSQLLLYEKLDPELWFRRAIAYNNILDEDKSLKDFNEAYNLDPDNKIYNFMLAKACYGKEKYKAAESLLAKLCKADSLNWTYASYLTSIYMLHNRYDEAISIYSRFLAKDSMDYNFIDKIAFATLKKGDHIQAKELYTRSLEINDQNLIPIKNLAYIFSAARQSDTAIAILSRGIEIDSTDMSLYSMRGQLYFSKNYNKKALDDYLTILASGDSSKLFLKRAGIGYCNNMQPRIAITYLMKAYRVDSSDYETCSYLGQSYYNLKDLDKSIYFYKRVISILTPIYKQMGLSYSLLAESQQSAGLYREGVRNLLKSHEITGNPAILMFVANIYDEMLNESGNALRYYETFLEEIKKSGGTFSAEYLSSIRDRIDYLKSEPAAK